MKPISRLLGLRRPLTLAAAVLAGVATLWLGAGVSVDETLKAARHGFRTHAASGEIHIVEIDEKSIAAIARWPWPRGVHAAAVDRLHAAGARSIAFDVDFSSPSDPAEDARFAAALERAGRGVILPVFRQYAGAGSDRAIEAAPIPALAQRAFLAAANVDADADGRLRRMLFGLDIVGAPRPSLASLIAERPGAAGRSFAIDTSIDPRTIPRHSLIDVLRGRVPAAALRGKRVIVGATAVELGDRYAVPRQGVLPGVVAQVLAAETLLEGDPPVRRSGGWALILALLLVMATVLPKGRRGPRAASFAAGTGLLLLLPFAERTVGDLALAPALAALAAAALAGGGFWIALRHRETRLEDPETGLPNLLALERTAAGEEEIVIAAVRIEGLPALTSALGSHASAALLRTLADRLSFAVGGSVYRGDDATLAWLDREGVGLDERIEAVAALMRAPVGSGPAADVRLHYGAARGSGTEVRQLAASAGLAAANAAATGERWRLFTTADGEAVSRGVALLSEFGAALAEGQIRNLYQPKLDLATGAVVGVEALVRWDHPAHGRIAPDSFVPLIERQGRAAELTRQVLGLALADAARWAEAGCPLDVAVNVSASLLHDEPEMARLRAMVGDARVPPDRLTIEVTETAAMADPARGTAALEAWRSLGVGVSIDDYGTGQSSLAYLQTLPATELKIDKSFVASIAEAPRNAIMVRSTVAMAHELGLKVVAEGVEDEACLALLRTMGCDLAQGYLIARPMEAAAVAAFAAARPRAASAA